MQAAGDRFVTGPAIILNDGCLNSVSLTAPNKYGKYAIRYLMDAGNRSYLELVNIVDSMLKREGYEEGIAESGLVIPWTEGKKKEKGNNVVTASSKKYVPVIDWSGAKVVNTEARDGMSCKVNIKPFFYYRETQVQYRMPDGSIGHNTTISKGVSLMLNGIMLHDDRQKTEDLF